MKLVTALLFGVVTTANAAGLRLQTSTFNSAEAATIEQLAGKYDCRAASGDLVETVNNIIKKNSEDTAALNLKCTAIAAGYVDRWAQAEADHDAKYELVRGTEDDKEAVKLTKAKNDYSAVENQWCVKEFEVEVDGATTKPCADYGSSVIDSKIAADKAIEEAAASLADYTAAQLIYTTTESATNKAINGDPANNLPGLKKDMQAQRDAATLTHTQAEAAAHALYDVLILNGDADKSIKSATLTKTDQLAECTRLYDLRFEHIHSDSTLLDKVEVDLQQLKICDADGKAQADNQNRKLISLLQTTSTANAACAAHKKNIQSLLQVASVPVGTYEEFRARVTKETTNMESEKTSCDTDAVQTFDTTKKAADDQRTSTISLSLKERDASLAQYTTDEVSEEARLNKLVADAKKICCSTNPDDNSKWSINEAKTATKTTDVAAFAGLVVEGKSQMFQAHRKQIDDVARAHKEKVDGIANTYESLRIAYYVDEKTSIDQQSKEAKDDCKESLDFLVDEAALVAKIQANINTGGFDQSGLRVVGTDRVGTSDGSAPISDAGVRVDSAAIHFDTSLTAKDENFEHLSTMDAATSLGCYRVDCGHGTCSSTAKIIDANFDFNDRGDTTLSTGTTYTYKQADSAIEVSLLGWTHTRNYAAGFLMNNPTGDAYATVSNLIPNKEYHFKVYQIVNNNKGISLQINGIDKGLTTQRNTDQPSIQGKVTATSEGKVVFKFHKIADHIHLSKITFAADDSYSCTCAEGYSGTHCGTDVDDCASNPCKNSATCTDLVNDFSCTCATGWSGKTCDTDIDDCASNPCKNGGTCTDNFNSHTCTCKAGFSGDDCETNVDDCASNPCKNGGTCHDGVSTYTCECAHGWTGDNCETVVNGFAPTDSDQCIAGAKRRDVGVLYMRIKYQNTWRSGVAIRCGYKPGTWIQLVPKNYENIENGKTLINFGGGLGWPGETSNPVHVKEGYGPDMSEWIQFTQKGDLRVFQSPVTPSDSDTGTSVSETFNVDGETYKRLNRVVDGWWGEHLFGVRFEPWKCKAGFSGDNCETNEKRLAEEAAATGHSVTCEMTIDKFMDSVEYNGKKLSVNVGGVYKTVTFTTAYKGRLVVAGHDHGGSNIRDGYTRARNDCFCHHAHMCSTGGFAIQCHSPTDSFWGNFNSNSENILAQGSETATGTQAENADIQEFTWKEPKKACKSGVANSLSHIKKIWAPNGVRNAKFTMGPEVGEESQAATTIPDESPYKPYLPRTDGLCTDDGRSYIGTAEDCTKGFKAAGWRQPTHIWNHGAYDMGGAQGLTYPPGCQLNIGNSVIYFNTNTASTVPCSKNNKCLCTSNGNEVLSNP